MFHTEELQKIINQLQHAQVDGIGYFDTLLLILKLIVLCAKPVLFVICLILSLIWIPKWISYKLTPTPDNMKRYYCYFILKRKGEKYRLERKDPILQLNTIKNTDDYLKLLQKRGFLRYKITCGFSVIVLLLISPFLFTETMRFPVYVFMVVMVCILSYVYVIYHYEFELKGWEDIAKEDKLSETKDQFAEKVIKTFEEIDPNQLKDMSKKEIARILGIRVNDPYYKILISRE